MYNILNSKYLITPIDDSEMLNPMFVEYIANLNSPRVNVYSSRARYPISEKQAKNYINTNDNNRIIFMIICASNSEHVGNVSIQSIDHINQSCEIAFFIFEKYSKKGVGFNAGKALLSHAFNQLNMNRVWLGTVESNEGMRAIANKLGMNREGTQREAFIKNMKKQDIINYSILRYEYEENHGTV